MNTDNTSRMPTPLMDVTPTPSSARQVTNKAENDNEVLRLEGIQTLIDYVFEQKGIPKTSIVQADDRGPIAREYFVATPFVLNGAGNISRVVIDAQGFMYVQEYVPYVPKQVMTSDTKEGTDLRNITSEEFAKMGMDSFAARALDYIDNVRKDPGHVPFKQDFTDRIQIITRMLAREGEDQIPSRFAEVVKGVPIESPSTWKYSIFNKQVLSEL